MIGKILERPAHAAVIIGCSQNKHISRLHPFLERAIVIGRKRGIRIYQRQGFCREVQNIHHRPLLAQPLGHMEDGHFGHRRLMQAADYGHHV